MQILLKLNFSGIGDLSRCWLFCLGVSVSQMTSDMFRFSYSQPGPFLKRNTTGTGVTCGAGTAYLSGGPEFTLGFKWCSYCSIFSFLCKVLQIDVCVFVLFLLGIVLSVLRFTASDDPFDIFKLFLANIIQYHFPLQIIVSISLLFLKQRPRYNKCKFP